MKLHQQVTPNVNTIRAFERDSIRINNKSYSNSLIVTADIIQDKWTIEHPEQISVETISQLLAYQPEVILIGTGQNHHLLEPMLSLEATQQGIGIEIMTTEAACRTYNVLLGEDRAVLAALIIEKNAES